MVANLFARADVRDPEQRLALERYMLEPGRSEQELAALAGVYPNANRMISNNLLTGKGSQSGESIIAHDRAALAIVGAWLNDPRFDTEKLRPHVRAMYDRLANFVRQADDGSARQSP